MGRTLHDRINSIIKGDLMEEWQIASIMQQLLQAVNYLHKNDVVHRDLKPENIAFLNENTKSLKIKLIDFGTAQKFRPGQYMI